MPTPRTRLISLDATSYYHVMSRVVRRSFLCGQDKLTNRNYDHRKQWIVTRMRQLATVFAIDICAYAVLSNHFHLVLHVDNDRLKALTLREVAERWLMLFRGNFLVDRWMEGEKLSDAECVVVGNIIEEWRHRLTNISWFMRCLNEPIAREANKEDDCTGRFWEGRFKSQALLDEVAILSCMTYVDLNPIRAGIADTLEESDYTSIQVRLYEYAKSKAKPPEGFKTLQKRVEHQKQIERENQAELTATLKKIPKAKLMRFDGCAHTSVHAAIPFTRKDYFDLVDQTGRVIRADKKGFIKGSVPSILTRLGIEESAWIHHIESFGKNFTSHAGSPEAIRKQAKHHNRKWLKGISKAKGIYREKRSTTQAA